MKTFINIKFYALGVVVLCVSCSQSSSSIDDRIQQIDSLVNAVHADSLNTDSSRVGH